MAARVVVEVHRPSLVPVLDIAALPRFLGPQPSWRWRPVQWGWNHATAWGWADPSPTLCGDRQAQPKLRLTLSGVVFTRNWLLSGCALLPDPT